MEIQKHIVKRVTAAPDRQGAELRERDVEILDAWFWPASESDDAPARAEPAGRPRV